MTGEVIVAFVRAGTAYPFEYVTKLRNMVMRHLDCGYTIVCLTDQPERCEGVTFVDVTELGLKRWWTKMILFATEWRERKKIIYIDLDTIIIGDITPLADVPGEFAILERMTQHDYPSRYNSSVMVIGGGMAGFVWTSFDKNRAALMKAYERYGDGACLEELYPNAPSLQRLLPKGFFCHYRDITDTKPSAAMINFGGAYKPHDCPFAWARREWS
jgi:hypothetical protein